jgi:hypothetical protein
VAVVTVDSRDQVYVFSRGAHPVTVFDRDGSFLRSWGEGVFKRAHGLSMAPDDTIFCTDDGDHSGRRCTGWSISWTWRTITARGTESMPHNACFDEDGWVYVADRENHRVQIFKYQAEWHDLRRPAGTPS